MTEEELEKVKRVIGEPVLEEFTEDLRRTRRNLLVAASIAIFFSYYDLEIVEAGFLGIRFKIIPESAIVTGAAFLLAYLFTQFTWKAWDYVQHIRLRVSGSRLTHQTGSGWGSQDGDYPRQSTLYAWWVGRVPIFGNLRTLVDEILVATSDLKKTAATPDFAENPNLNNIINAATRAESSANTLGARIDDAVKTLTSQRIPTSLERFDRWFWNFQWSQRWRVIILDIGFPIFWCGWAICLMVRSIPQD